MIIIVIKGSMTGRDFYEAISNISFIQHEIKHILVVKPTFPRYTKVDEIYRKLTKISIPDEEQWDKLCEFQDIKYRSASPMQHPNSGHSITVLLQSRARCSYHFNRCIPFDRVTYFLLVLS